MEYKRESNTDSKGNGKAVAGGDKFKKPQQLENRKVAHTGDSNRRECQLGPLRCFVCNEYHKARDCPMKKKLSAITQGEEIKRT